MRSVKVGAQMPLRRSSRERAWTREGQSAAPGGEVVLDWVRVVVRRALRGGMEEVLWRWVRRDLRVEGGRVWVVWMVVGCGLLGASGEAMSRLSREDGTSSFGGAEDIVRVRWASKEVRSLVSREDNDFMATELGL